MWGMFYSTYDCSLLGIRGKDDIWNSITAGFLTGGTLAIRQGPKPAFRSALIGVRLLLLAGHKGSCAVDACLFGSSSLLVSRARGNASASTYTATALPVHRARF